MLTSTKPGRSWSLRAAAVAVVAAASVTVPGHPAAAEVPGPPVVGAPVMISVAPDGTPGNSPSTNVLMSADGSAAAFTSYASNLTSADTNDGADVFVWRRSGGGLTRVSLAADGHELAGGGTAVGISTDGRYVAFTATDPTVVPGAPTSGPVIYVRDTVTGTLRVGSALSDGTPVVGYSSGGLSADGRHVLFVSTDPRLGGVSACPTCLKLYSRDLGTGVVTPIRVPGPSALGSGEGWQSADGRFVSFVAGVDGFAHVFLADLTTGDVTQVDNGTKPVITPTYCCVQNLPRISLDGRWIVYVSTAGDQPGAVGGGEGGTFLYDRTTGTRFKELYASPVDSLWASSFAPPAGNGRYLWGVGLNQVTHTFDLIVHDRSAGSAGFKRVAADAYWNSSGDQDFMTSGDGLSAAYASYSPQTGAQAYVVQLLAPGTTVPAAPVVAAVTPADHAATVTWLRPADGGNPILGYTVTASPGGRTCSTVGADALTCTITGLTNGVNYTFTVAAHNAAGNSPPPSADSTGTTTGTTTPGAPPAPVGGVQLVPDPDDGTQVTLRWLAAASDLPITGYRATAQPGDRSCTTTGALSCTITGLTPGQHLTFTVVAINGAGTSEATYDPAADLSATLTASPGPVALGDAFTLTATVTNHGPAPATRTTATVAVGGATTTLLAATGGTGTCVIVGRTATCDVGALAPGASVTVVLAAEPAATGTVTATAVVAAAEPDPVPADNTAQRTVTVTNGHGCTIIGTTGNDTVTGTNGNDVICTLSGDDRVSAGNGDDVIYGGSGTDILDGGNGDDTIHAGPTGSTLIGGNGNDVLIGGIGNDTIYGDNGNDTIDAGDGNDTVYGGNGNDTIDAGGGVDTVDGGNGTDTCAHTETGTSCTP